MKKKVLIKAPALTQSGYGEHARFLLRAFRDQEDRFDLYLAPINWGKTNWIFEDNEERHWIDQLIIKTQNYNKECNGKGNFDMSVQVTIPNEWERLASINIGVTAGIETTKVAPEWLDKSRVVDRIIVPSNHSKDVYESTTYRAQNKSTGEVIENFGCHAPIEVIHYPARPCNPVAIDLELDYDFNFLTVMQLSERKNLSSTITWFVEEFIDREVGLIVKTNLAKNCTVDRHVVEKKLKAFLQKYPNRKCKVYLLHGYMKESEMAALYTHPKINCYITTTRGEGFGLPLFEAAYYALPIIAPGWSGQSDFLYMDVKQKNGKFKKKAMFARVDYNLVPIAKNAVWPGVLVSDSMWCEPEQGSFKIRLREVYKDYGRFKKQAKELRTWVLENFNEESQNEKFIAAIMGESFINQSYDYIFVSDFYSEQLKGGAELSLEALIDKSDGQNLKLRTGDLNETKIKYFKDKTWIFGNYSALTPEMMQLIKKYKLTYFVVEFDYKFCEYRNLDLHMVLEGERCDCSKKDHGKLIAEFLSNAAHVFFMSEKQLEITLQELASLQKENCTVISSVFSKDSIDKIRTLRKLSQGKPRSKWGIPSAKFWVKGAIEAKKWCNKNGKEIVQMTGMEYDKALETLAGLEGLCFLPAGADTCPRMVIEAKLLGCQLELNDNVQHLNEKWFKTNDLQKIEKYLLDVPDKFWRVVKENE